MPPPNRQQQPNIEDLNLEQAVLALATLRTQLGTDEDFEIILAASIKQFEEQHRTQRENQKTAISELEAHILEVSK